jgi:ABC-type bacteriocin/lantibiotic exporter with double-glycine peptidase domain
MQYYYQITNWECGVVAIRNALLTLGIDKSRKEIRELSRANRSDGTSKRGIVRALRGFDLNATVYQTRNTDYAYRWISKWSRHWPCILLLDDMEHWGTTVGGITDRIILVDPSMTGDDLQGVHVLNKKEILSRWIGRGWYYAIRVSQ